MGKLYKGQTDLTIEVKVDTDLTGFTYAKLVFKSPSGIEKIATSTTIKNTTLGILEFIANDASFFNETGQWRCWARCINEQGLISIGETDFFIICKEGNS